MKLTKQPRVYMLAICGVLACLVFSSPVFAQCSTAAWTSVTGTVQALGSSTNPIGKKYAGSCALTVDAGTAPGYVTTDLPVDEAVFSSRFYLLYDGLSISSGDVVIFEARNGGTVQARLSLRDIGGVIHMVASYRSGGGLVEHGDTFPVLAIWQGIVVTWTTGSGTGTFSLKFDEIEQFSASGLTNAGELVNEADLGVINTPSASGDVIVDAFEIRKSTAAPPLLTTNELRNISTRAEVQSVHEIVIAGFIITGETEKCVILRGRGPSVNVPAPAVRLEDPTLTLKSGSTTIDSNDNWADHPTAPILQALGRAPTEALDSALFKCLAPGAYTVLLRGAAGTAEGIGIVEVLDEDRGTPYLFNISTRAPVGTVHSIGIAGFVILGDQSRTVLIRGRGPTVSVPAPAVRLTDPLLTLKSGATTLEENDDWGDAANVADIIATGRAPVDPLESAILTTLPPGGYTVWLRASDGQLGIGIIEVLDLTGGSIANE